MPTSKARFETDQAAKYLAQLCKHFGHKIEVEHSENHGDLTFSFGKATLDADAGGLDLEVDAATPEDLAVGKDVLESHLLRFAFREEDKSLVWSV